MKEIWEWRRRDGSVLTVIDYGGRLYALLDSRDGSDDIHLTLAEVVRAFRKRVA